jgi:cyclic pyranopterin phosphate synthase
MSKPADGGLSHVGADGTARMVVVGAKPDTARMARATGAIRMAPPTLAAIVENRLAKGDVLAVARIAGIMAAKKTSELIPLCHPLSLTDVALAFSTDPTLPGVRVEAVA